MNLKYYLRGLGIGIVVSTLIVSISMGNKTETLSDEEIRQRARQLGMVEERVTLAEAAATPGAETEAAGQMIKPTEEPTEQQTEVTAIQQSEKPTVKPTENTAVQETEEVAEKPTAKPTEDMAVQETEEVAEKPTAKPAEDEAAQETEEVPVKQPGEVVTVVVRSGTGSYDVCKQLKEAGLIDSAEEFDTYLYKNGYDKRIVAAAHEIPADADEEQIALILTGNG